MRRTSAWVVGLGVVVVSILSLPVLPQGAKAAPPVDSLGLVDARAFLDEYQSSSAASSADFYELYSDRAQVHARVNGQSQGLVFQGRAYKAWGRALARDHRALPETSEFHQPTVEERGSRLIIRASRYSVTRCYWDPTYAVALEKEGTAYRIVEEHLTTDPTSLCHAGPEASASTHATGPAGPPASISAGPPAPGTLADWHPLSQQDIAASAMRLVKQAAARPVPPAPATGDPAELPPSRASSVSAAAQTPPTHALWITPDR